MPRLNTGRAVQFYKAVFDWDMARFFIFANLLLISVVGFAQETYIPAANEELYGTWIKDESVVINSPAEQWQKTISFQGGYKNYTLRTDAQPSTEGKETIQSKWTDSDGSVWYKTFGEITAGSYEGLMFEELRRLSKNATVKESVWFQVYKYDEKSYPQKIDSQSATYAIYNRAAN